jgi:hypothetical protein
MVMHDFYSHSHTRCHFSVDLILVSVVGYLRNVCLSMFTLRQYVILFPYNLVLKSVQYLSRTGSGIQRNEEFVIFNVPNVC